MWSIAFSEAIFLRLAGIQVGNLLATIFGNPLFGAWSAEPIYLLADL
jgi:hypothetical protein